MSANNSDSESGGSSLHGWTLVSPGGNIERSGDESSSSVEFVKVQDDHVSFHHKDRRHSNSPSHDSSPVSASAKADDGSGDQRTSSSVLESLEDAENELQSAEELHQSQRDGDEDGEHAADDVAAAVSNHSMDGVPDRVEDLPASSNPLSLPAPGPAPAPRPSESDSDSDFVRLEPSMADEEVAVEEGAVGGVGARVMEASQSSSISSGSSISASFRFVQPSQSPAYRMPPPHYEQPRRGSRPVFVADDDYDDDDDSVDDRCESDISGVAADESDLSSFTYNLGDIPLEEGKHIYQHQPNNNLNSVLTTVTLLAFCLGMGIGIGHYMGTTWDRNLRQQYITRLHSLQDDYLNCLKHQDRLEGLINVPKEEESKWNAIISQWKTNYEKLTIEKVVLQDDLINAQDCGTDDILMMKRQLNQLHQERDDLIRQVTALRYSKHPANDLQHPDDLKVKVNDLAIENADLKSMVGKLRYTKGTTFDAADEGIPLDKSTQVTPDVIIQDVEASSLVAEKPQSGIDVPWSLDESSNSLALPDLSVVNDAALLAQYDELQELIASAEQKSLINALMTEDDANSDDGVVVEVEDEIISEDVPVIESNDQVTPSVMEPKPHVGMVPSGVIVMETAVETSAVSDQEAQLDVTASDSSIEIPPSELLTSMAEDDLSGSCDATNGSEVVALKEALQQANSELELERKRVHLWQSLYVAEKMTHDQHPPPPHADDSSDFIGCLLMAMNWVPSNVDNLWESLENLTEPVSRHQTKARQVAVEGVKLLHEFWRNMTDDMSLVDTLQQQWQKVSPTLESPELDQISKNLISAYNKVNDQIRQKWQDFEIYINLHSKGTNADADASNLNSTGHLSSYINKTKATVTELSNTIQDTWAKVKNLSEDFVSKHQDKVTQLQEQVVEKVTKIGKQAAQKLDKVQQKVADFVTRDPHSRSTTKNGSQYRHTSKEQSDQHQQQQQQQQHQQHQQQHRAYPYDETYHYDEPVGSQGQFEDKPLHKQKQSSNHEQDQKYKEFWHHTGFEPDDFEQDGFFEGNNREWRKHQKRLHKLHSRINRLNEDMLATMDDDDIEDIYEDLEDFEEDIEDEVQPQRLKTWLTCQLRWWKSRFQRKHRSDDLLKACSKQLMHWQLRLLCKTKCTGKKTSCKTFNKLCKTVAPNSDSTKPKCHNDNCKHDRVETPKKNNFQDVPKSPEPSHDLLMNVDKPRDKIVESEPPQRNAELNPIDEELVNATSWDVDAMTNWYFQRAQLRENNHQSVDGKWFLNRMDAREDTRHSSDWYLHPHQTHDDGDGSWFVKRMANRDDHRSDGSWFFHPHQTSFDEGTSWVFNGAAHHERQKSQPNADDHTKHNKFHKTDDHDKFEDHQRFHKNQMKEHARYHRDQMREHQRFHEESQRVHNEFVKNMEKATENMHRERFGDGHQFRRQHGYR